MFNFIVMAIFLAFGFIGFSCSDEALHIIGIVLLSVATVYFVIWVITELCSNFMAKQSFEEFYQTQRDILLLEQKKFELLDLYRRELTSKYPDFEKEIFEKIASSSGEKMNLTFQYPEIKSSEGMLKLTMEVSSALDSLYDLKSSLEDHCKKIRVRKVSPWLILQPSIPKEIQEYMDNSLPAPVQPATEEKK